MIEKYASKELKIWPSSINNLNSPGITRSSRLSIFQGRNYQPAPVRMEFKKPISLKMLNEINYEPGKHYKPIKTSDTVAYYLVQTLRKFADVFFQKRYVNRAIVIETVAAIPGVVGGLFRHLYSLKNCMDNGEVISKLMREAENERQHLLTFLEVKNPSVLDRILITVGQAFFFNFYFMFYFLFPKTAHRFVGYLEEEAIVSYTEFEKEILNGNIENCPAPKIAIEYWKLPENARLLDVVKAVRADEAAHRDANHEYADNKDEFYE